MNIYISNIYNQSILKKKGVDLNWLGLYNGVEDLLIANEDTAELKYYITEQEVYYEETELKTLTYGMEIEKIQSNKIEACRIDDVTCECERALEIIELLKNNKVLPVHLEDVILDILS